MSSSNKVALVTGGGTGIGRAAAVELHKSGYELVLAGRRQEPLEETASIVGKKQVHVMPTDIGNTDEIDALFAKIKSQCGRIDLLFNNAGIGAPRVPMDELDVADWKRCVDINLTGSFVCAQHTMRMMKAQNPTGGRIINNGSVSAHSPRPNTPAYTSTKHA
nr:SDR family oxidoreductase [Granulosicoccus sp.]